MSNSSLPEDLIFDILLRLPVKSLLRFKSVCRSWRSMITGRCFVSKHLKRSSMNDSSAGVHHLMKYRTVGERSQIALLSSTLEVRSEVETPTMTSSYNYFEIVGSCNGIVCLISQSRPALLWNPATRESRTVPNPVAFFVWPFSSDESCCFSEVRYGFGYSSKIDDYKLVRIGHCDRPWAEVFTLREGSWREVQPPDYYPDHHHIGGTLVNRTLNWIARGVRDESQVMSFDLEKDEFKSIFLPPRFEEGLRMKKKVAALEWSLLFIAYSWLNVDRRIDLWMTNPQATQPIWTRLTSIYPLVPHPWPLGVGKGGEIYVANCSGDKQLYAWEASTGNALYSVAGIPSPDDLHPYVESLVPLLGE